MTGVSDGGRTRGAPSDLEWGVARGLAVFRWFAWAWAVAVLVVTRADLARPGAAVGLLGLVAVVNAATTEAAIRRRPALFGVPAIAGQVLVGAGLLVADGWVYEHAHGQTFGSAWPVAAALAAGIAFGPVSGAGAGLLIGAGRALGHDLAPFDDASTLALVSSAVLFTLAGGAGGAAMDRMRTAETEVARARAREEIARTLHDGVLQTLAVIQRRSTDNELAALARDQELDLRAYLAGDRPATVDLPSALRSAAAHVERRDGLRVEVLFVEDDLPEVAPEVVDAVAGAVREALTNAAKHGQAKRATVFVDVDDAVFCSVKDDGVGFDPATTTPGLGTTSSIKGPLAALGGRATIDARPGSGVEVRLEAPLRPRNRARPTAPS